MRLVNRILRIDATEIWTIGWWRGAHNESGGKTYRKFYGMSSEVAMEKYSGGVAKYRDSEGKAVTLEARPGRSYVAGSAGRVALD